MQNARQHSKAARFLPAIASLGGAAGGPRLTAGGDEVRTARAESWHYFCFPGSFANRSVPRMRSVPATNRLNPRTNRRKRAVGRFCGNCGYELAPEGDGTCPMCPRFEQFLLDFPLPQPNQRQIRARRHVELLDPETAIARAEHAPTVSDYGLIGVEHARSGSTGRSVPTGPRIPAVRATLAPPADTAGSFTSASGGPPEATAPPSPQQSKTRPQKGTELSGAITAGPDAQGVVVRHQATPSHVVAMWPSPESVATVVVTLVIGALVSAAVPQFLSWLR